MFTSECVIKKDIKLMFFKYIKVLILKTIQKVNF